MKSVHHPSKNIFIFVIPKAFPPIIKPNYSADGCGRITSTSECGRGIT